MEKNTSQTSYFYLRSAAILSDRPDKDHKIGLVLVSQLCCGRVLSQDAQFTHGVVGFLRVWQLCGGTKENSGRNAERMKVEVYNTISIDFRSFVEQCLTNGAVGLRFCTLSGGKRKNNMKVKNKTLRPSRRMIHYESSPAHAPSLQVSNSSNNAVEVQRENGYIVYVTT